ncbi:Hsp20/alpha crystallin family protein [Paenibacillus sp. TRM 82003]|nr:Hsp20/alpha crystallin family protein [Paenibacillus sp. TRM 82003]
MSHDQFKKWFETAERFQNEDFWRNVFDTFAPAGEQKPHNFDLHKNTPEYPLIDVREGAGEVILDIALPGMYKEHIEMTIVDHKLEIKGKGSDIEEKYTFLHKERNTEPFTRVFPLPKGIDPAKGTAQFHNGLLTIKFPKVKLSKTRLSID